MHLFPFVPQASRWRFHARPQWRVVPALAAALVFAIAFAAGQWQSGRAGEKDAVEVRRAVALDAAAINWPADPLDSSGASIVAGKAEPAQLDGRRIALRGRFLNDKTLFLDNQVQSRIAGYHVLTPFQTESGPMLLVNRGWVRVGASRASLPVIPAVSGMISIEGRVALPPKNIYEIKTAAAQPNVDQVWQNLQIAAIAQRAGLELPSYVLRQSSDTADGLTRVWDAPTTQTGMTAAKHRGYAFQWYALAALTAFLFLFFTFIDYGQPSRNP